METGLVFVASILTKICEEKLSTLERMFSGLSAQGDCVYRVGHFLGTPVILKTLKEMKTSQIKIMCLHKMNMGQSTLRKSSMSTS